MTVDQIPPEPVKPSVVLTMTMKEAQDLMDVCNKASVHSNPRVCIRATNFYHVLRRGGIELRNEDEA